MTARLRPYAERHKRARSRRTAHNTLSGFPLQGARPGPSCPGQPGVDLNKDGAKLVLGKKKN